MQETKRFRRKGGAMIFGVFFLVLGLSIVLKVVFHWDIPVMRSLMGIFLIYLGIRMVFGGFLTESGGVHSWGWTDDSNAVFSQQNFKFPSDGGGSKKYSVVFGSSNVDLTGVDLSKSSVNVQVDCVFGEMVVTLPKNANVRIRANAVFGEARMPNDNLVAFGTLNYSSPSEDKEQSLNITGNVVFGSLRFQSAKN